MQKEYSVESAAGKRKELLRSRVEHAGSHARQVTRDPETGDYLEFTAEALSYREFLKQEGIHTYKRERAPYLVSVDDPHEYLTLIKLALRYILTFDGKFSEDEVDYILRDEAYRQWFITNGWDHLEHELSEHYFTAREYSDLKCYFGVEFFRNETGKLNFRPYFDMTGQVPAEISRRIAEGSSVFDRIVNSKNI